MKNSKYSLEELSYAQIQNFWDEKVYQSQQGTIFHLTSFLEHQKEDCRFVVISKGDHMKCLAPFKLKQETITNPDLCIHAGPIFLHESQDGQSLYKLQNQNYEILECLVENYLSCFKKVDLNLAPGVVDIRPFLWHNYHNSNGPHYQSTIRYTSFLKLDQPLDYNDTNNSIYKGLGPSRRQEISYGKRDAVTIEESQDYPLFFKMYEEFSAKYDPDCRETSAQYLKVMDHIAAHKSETLKVYLAYTAQGEIKSGALFLLDNKRAYYLLGFSHDREFSYMGSSVLWYALSCLSKKVSEIDFEGINSPKRGWFKLSFGGTIVPYYCLTKD